MPRSAKVRHGRDCFPPGPCSTWAFHRLVNAHALRRADSTLLKQYSPQNYASDRKINDQSCDINQGSDEWSRCAGGIETAAAEYERQHLPALLAPPRFVKHAERLAHPGCVAQKYF